jgi:primosomal protein N'
MIARVIPGIRAPRRLGAFDYGVPEGIDLARGSLVSIPFRASEIIGLVGTLSDQVPPEDIPLKPISKTYANLILLPETVELLERLSSRAFSSPASVLRAWIGTCPKRPKVHQKKTTVRLAPNLTERLSANHLSGPDGIIAAADSFRTFGAKTLILTPWAERADLLSKHLNAKKLTSAMPMGARFAAWSAFVQGESDCLVATRIGAWLSLEADAVILDEPENDDHKQDELAPRYDARWTAEYASRFRPVVSIGLTPRLRDARRMRADAIPSIEPEFIRVDVSGRDWSSVPGLQNRTLSHIEDATREQRPVIVIHPIHGDRARLRCADCSWEAVCRFCGASLRIEAGRAVCIRCKRKSESAASCEVCGSSNLSSARPGRERLERDLRPRFGPADLRILSAGEWNAMDELPHRSLIVCTDLALLSGGAEDLRRKERLIVGMRRLADRAASSSSVLCIQADAALLAEARQWLTGSGLKESMEREYAEREAFRFPPAYQLVKIIFRGNEQAVRLPFERLAERLSIDPAFRLNGLFPVPFRVQRDPRWIAQIVTPLSTDERAIADAVEPALSSNAIIDLDPIAFFE